MEDQALEDETGVDGGGLGGDDGELDRRFLFSSEKGCDWIAVRS